MARNKTKRLLSEGEMRRFMKLASISPMNEMYGMAPGQRDEEEEMPMGDEMEVSADEVEMDVEEPAADLPDEEPAMDDMEMDMEPAGDAGMVDVEQFMSALESALEEVTGEEVSTVVDMEEPGDEMAPEQGGDDAPVEMPEEPAMMDDEERDSDDEEDDQRKSNKLSLASGYETMKQYVHPRYHIPPCPPEDRRVLILDVDKTLIDFVSVSGNLIRQSLEKFISICRSQVNLILKKFQKKSIQNQKDLSPKSSMMFLK